MLERDEQAQVTRRVVDGQTVDAEGASRSERGRPSSATTNPTARSPVGS